MKAKELQVTSLKELEQKRRTDYQSNKSRLEEDEYEIVNFCYYYTCYIYAISFV